MDSYNLVLIDKLFFLKQFMSSVPEVFRGFPPNEISMIHSHVKNVNYVYNTLDNNIPHIEACINIKQNFLSNVNEEEESLKLQSKLKWLQTPHFQLSIDKFNNYNHCNIANVSHTLYQVCKNYLLIVEM